jgi:hypothetical protein
VGKRVNVTRLNSCRRQLALEVEDLEALAVVDRRLQLVLEVEDLEALVVVDRRLQLRLNRSQSTLGEVSLVLVDVVFLSKLYERFDF